VRYPEAISICRLHRAIALGMAFCIGLKIQTAGTMALVAGSEVAVSIGVSTRK